MILDALADEIETCAAVIASYRRQIDAEERRLARLQRELKDRMLKPAPRAGEKETTDG